MDILKPTTDTKTYSTWFVAYEGMGDKNTKGNFLNFIWDHKQYGTNVVQFQEKFSFRKKVLLPKILLQLPTVHYGCYSQVSLRCELYTVSTTWMFFTISQLAIIMKSDHDQKQPSSTATPYIPTVHYGL